MANHPFSRREFLRLAGAGTAALAFPSTAFTAERRKPNIIVILADDMGYADMGCQGCADIPTPNIDSIARGGVRFTSGYVTCPVCSPTRAGMLTGRYQQRFGHEDNPGQPGAVPPDCGLPVGEKTLADYLRAEGYATGLVGKWHLGYEPKFHPQARGFDEFFGFLSGMHSYLDPDFHGADPIFRGTKQVDEKEYLTDALGREAVSFIERHHAEPFFLYLAFNAIHTPMEGSPKYADEFTGIEDKKRRTLAHMLKPMDDAIGSVLSKVRERGLEKDTLIFFLSDNGGPTDRNGSRNTPLSGQKGDVLEGGIRVPFVVQWKGRLPADKTFDRPVISLDILPTAVAAAGGKAGANIEGVDLLPYLRGQKSGRPHDALFWRFIGRTAARVGDWKLVHAEEGAPAQLFDLSADIGERNDLAERKPEKVREIEAAFREWDAKNIPARWRWAPVKKK